MTFNIFCLQFQSATIENIILTVYIYDNRSENLFAKNYSNFKVTSEILKSTIHINI